MQQHPRSRRFVIIALTVTWAITIPLELMFWINVVGWTIDLALLMSLPILGVWVPLSYPLAIAENERHQRGTGLDSSADVFTRSGLLGVLSGGLSICAVWMYMLIQAAVYWGMVVVGFLVLLLLFATVWTFHNLLVRIGNHQNK